MMGKNKYDINGTSVTTDSPKQKDVERGNWGSPAEFILSCLGYAVGLGNVWRFPYLCYTNGGGAFLIPYFLMLTFVGIPTFLIELAVGQYSQCGPATVWEVAPLFKGVGIAMMAGSLFGSIYYNAILTWALYYLFASFNKVLPWTYCDNDFNTEACYSKAEAEGCESINGTWYNQTCFNETYFDDCQTDSCFTKDFLKNVSYVSPSEEYFNYEMLDRSDRIEDVGYIKWDLCLCLLLAWIICYLCIIKGITSTGKVVYFTATFPYVLLVILFFRAVTLEGAWEGIKFYLLPKWEQLAKPKVWADAAGQIFFSLSVGTGGLMTFASYNKFHNNIYRDTLFVSIANCLTSFFAGFVIFSVLGFMAVQRGVAVDDVVSSGSGLAFVAYPEVVTLLPISQLWSFMFFFMLLTLGLDSQFATLENLQTAITDVYPGTRKFKPIVSGIMCVLLFLLGLIQVTKAGVYWIDLISYYSGGFAIVLLGTLEGIVFPWIYGADRLLDDIEAMVGFRLWRHWWFCWKFITPTLLVVILIMNFVDFTPLAFGTYVLPPWSQAIGWMIALLPCLCIPVFAVLAYRKSYQNPDYDGLKPHQRIIKLCKPTDNWISGEEREKRSQEDRSEQGFTGQEGSIAMTDTQHFDNKAYVE